MKYCVKFCCGHEANVELVGSEAVRKQKLAGLEKSLCDNCLSEELTARHSGCTLREMFIEEYEADFADCQRLKVNGDLGMVMVWVPQGR